MRKQIWISIISIFMIFIIIPVFASEQQTGFNVQVIRDLQQAIVTVNVSLINPVKSMPVTIKVTGSDGALNYIEQKYSDAAGHIAFKYINKGAAGKYNLTVKVPALNQVYSDNFEHLNTSDLERIRKTVEDEIKKSSSNVAVLKAAIFDNKEGLGLKTEIYNKLQDQDSVFAAMVSDKKTNSVLKNINDVVNAFYASVATCTINERKSVSEFETFLSDPIYINVFKVKDIIPAYASDITKTIYDSYNNDIKQQILASVTQEAPYSTFSQMRIRLAELTLTCGIKKVAHWKDVQPILVAYQKFGAINISFDRFNKLRDSSAVLQKMMESGCSSYIDVENKFNEYVANQEEFESDKTPKNNERSGSGPRGSIKVPIPEPSVTPKAPAVSAEYAPMHIFKDMDDALWAVEVVETLAQKGIISGISTDTFEPNRSINRAECVKLLVSLLGPADKNADISETTALFSDLHEDNWSYPYVIRAYNLGWVKGDGESMFNGNKAVSREEMAVMVVRTFEKLGIDVKSGSNSTKFLDEKECSSWAIASVLKLYQANIVKGKNGNLFDPKGELTRAEFARVIYNLLNLMKK